MIQLNLTQNDIRILTQLLENCITDLRSEIRASDNYAYKRMLKERKVILSKLYDSLVKLDEEMPIAE
jgi:hypothetical protein